jgi:hypothetical protein
MGVGTIDDIVLVFEETRCKNASLVLRVLLLLIDSLWSSMAPLF